MPTPATGGQAPAREPRPGVVRYLVTPELVGLRLDQGLAVLTGVPRRRARSTIADGSLWLNGRATRVLSRKLHLADVVDVFPGAGELSRPSAPPLPLPILHEDRWIVVVDKPARLATQAPRNRFPGELTVHETLLLQLAARDGHRVEVLLFHRLDRPTTGVLVFALHHEAARGLAAVWGTPAVRKKYLAVVAGDPGEGTRTLAGKIGPDPLAPGRLGAGRRGQPATTRVRRIAKLGTLSLVEASPVTGRTHQVRVHLAEAGCPVAGDRTYGGGGGVPRPFLHAWRLTLPHPRDRKILRLTAPIPADMASFLAALGLPTGMLETG